MWVDNSLDTTCAISPIRPRNIVWGYTLTVVELETSEEKAELSWIQDNWTGNLYPDFSDFSKIFLQIFVLCCCWDEQWTAFNLVYNFKRNKGGDSPSARTLIWASSVAAQMKMLCGAKKSKLKTLFACWYIVYRISQSNFIWLPSARFGLMWQRLCSPPGNQETWSATDLGRSPAMRTLQRNFHALRRRFLLAPEPGGISVCSWTAAMALSGQRHEGWTPVWDTELKPLAWGAAVSDPLVTDTRLSRPAGTGTRRAAELGSLCLPPLRPSGASKLHLSPSKHAGERGELGLGEHRTNNPPAPDHPEEQAHRLPGYIQRDRR